MLRQVNNVEARSSSAKSPARFTSQLSDRILYRTCVYPLVIFLFFTLLLAVVDSWVGWDHPEAAWWRRMPELWVYPLQTFVCAGWLWHVRRDIVWDWSYKPCLLGALAGLIGIGIWLLPYFACWVPSGGGFQPERIFGVGTVPVYVEYVLRFARAVIVVPLAEELFWRGFLMRWCVNRDFPQTVPVGQHSWLGFVVVVLLFVLAHHPQDYAAALLYGIIAYGLVVYTRRLTPAIVMHMVANLVLGICAVGFDLPHLW